MRSSFAEDVSAFADAGCNGIEVWLTKLEAHLQSHSTTETRRLLEDRDIQLAAGTFQGGLLLAQGDKRRANYDHFQRRLSICQELNIPTIVMAVDSVERVEAVDLQRAQVSLQQAAQLAAEFGVQLALEFQAKSGWCSSLDTACAFLASCESPNVGVCFDLFHYYVGPSKLEDLRQLTKQNLAFVQLSDLAGVPRELATDGDRILPGDGDFQIGPILKHFQTVGYDGWVSVELMNPEIWRMKPVSVAEAALASVNRLLGQSKDAEARHQ
jgi:sugar phosphate isomerase/epimerase